MIGEAGKGSIGVADGTPDEGWRRGHRYGTILVDLERSEVVDLLPNRQAETLATWLREHPGVEIVARDRAGAYADGIRQGAPDAVQIADRWHLLRNLGDAVRTVVDRQHVEVRKVARQIADEAFVPAASVPLVPPDTAKPTAAQQRSQNAHARRQARYEEAARLKTAGASLKRIAALIGAERKTVRRWLRAGRAPLWRKPERAGGLALYHDHLDRRWTEGCHNAAQLWREIITLGFAGRPSTVRQWATMAKVPMATAIGMSSEGGRRRKHEPHAAGAPKIHAVRGEPASARQIASQLMTDYTLPPTGQNFVSYLLLQVPGLANASQQRSGSTPSYAAEARRPWIKCSRTRPARRLDRLSPAYGGISVPYRRRLNFPGSPAPRKAK